MKKSFLAVQNQSLIRKICTTGLSLQNMQVKSPRDSNTEQSGRNLIKNWIKMWSLIWMMMRLVYSPCSHSTKHLEALRCNYHQHLFSSWTFLVRSSSHQTVLLRPWFLLLKPRKPLNFKYRNTTLPRGLSAVCIKWILSDQKKWREFGKSHIGWEGSLLPPIGWSRFHQETPCTHSFWPFEPG